MSDWLFSHGQKQKTDWQKVPDWAGEWRIMKQQGDIVIEHLFVEYIDMNSGQREWRDANAGYFPQGMTKRIRKL